MYLQRKNVKKKKKATRKPGQEAPEGESTDWDAYEYVSLTDCTGSGTSPKTHNARKSTQN